MDYTEYRNRISQWLSEDKTSGTNHSEAMLHYTRMNERRMKRLDKKPELLPNSVERLSQIKETITLLIITEAWCGDAAQIIPVIERMFAHNSNLTTRYIWRDENTELIDLYRTDGGRGIPKILFLDSKTNEVLGSWGPRPEEAQQLVRDYKENPTIPYSEFSEKLHKWYARDKTVKIQNEFTDALLLAIKKLPSELGS